MIRVCKICTTTKSLKSNGHSHWYLDWSFNGIFYSVLCKKCWAKLHAREVRKNRTRKDWSDIYHKSSKRTFTFVPKRTSKTLPYEIKIGVCNWCRAVVPFDTPKTHIHHVEYDMSNPSANIIEVCVKCHWKEEVFLGRIKLGKGRDGRPRFLKT